MTYLQYALGQLLAAMDKADVAPAAAAGHEQNVLLALRLQRVPTVEEWNASWTEADQATRIEALKAALADVRDHIAAVCTQPDAPYEDESWPSVSHAADRQELALALRSCQRALTEAGKE